MAGKKWTEGVSRFSIGRFGGFRDDCVPYNDGYLTASASARRVFLEQPDGRSEELGHFQVPGDFSLTTRTTWTGRRYEFRDAAGRLHSVVTRSLLFPGFHHRVYNGLFEYYWRIRNYGATDCILPLAGGLKHVPGPRGYDAARDGPLARPWVLFYFAHSAMPHDYPLLLVFDKPPTRIEVWTHEYLKVQFATKRAVVVMVHPFGAERLDKAATARWARRLPKRVERKLDFWAAAAMACPVGCREYFQIDQRRGLVKIRNEYRYERAKSHWKLKPIPLAPLPPVLAGARHAGYPVRIRGKVMERLCPTFSGYYEAVAGETLAYEIPLSRFRNHTLAPMRVVNSPLADKITRRLTEYLESGRYLTFGGDETYDPKCSLDSLHDLRILAWALWSIPAEKRPGALKLLTRGLGELSEADFIEFAGRRTGAAWVRHKTIFDDRGVIDYDAEWYNGMNLAGLWAYAYYADAAGADAAAAAEKLIRRRWKLIRKINAYTLAYSDWAHLVSWTCARGEALWLDGLNYTYEGLLGFAALARRIGRSADAELGDYLAAKAEAFMWYCWRGDGYAREHFRQADADRPGCLSAYFEGQPVRAGRAVGWSCGVYSYLVREIFLLLADMGMEDKLRQFQAEFRRDYPRWLEDPYGYGQGGHPGRDARRTIHHYFLDPRIMIDTLLLGRGPRRYLAKSGEPLTGPVLECMLVSLAPRVLIPRDVRFGGAVWDAAARTLTVRLTGHGRTTIALAHAGRPAAKTKKLLAVTTSPGRTNYTLKLTGQTDITFSFPPDQAKA